MRTSNPGSRRGALRSAAAAIAVMAGLSMVTACAGTAASRGEQEVVQNREIVAAAFDRWRAGTGGPFDLLADDATWTIVGSSPMSRTYRSREEFLREVIRPFNARVRIPLVPTVLALHADGDTVIVMFEGVATATDGHEYRNTYSWHLQLESGRIVRATAFFDTRVFDELWTRVRPQT